MAQAELDTIPPLPIDAAASKPDATQSTPLPLTKTPWFDHAGIREQLKLSDASYAELKRGYERAWIRYNDAMRAQQSSLTENSFTEKEARLRERRIYSTFVSDFAPTINQVLPTPELRRRYDELFLQFRGYGAFTDPEIQDRLRLTDDQVQQFNGYHHDWNRRLNTWRNNYPKSPDSVASEYNESRKEIETRVHALLSIEQRRQWHELRGQAYDFDRDVYLPDSAATRPVSR
jgi:hypothetical protein